MEYVINVGHQPSQEFLDAVGRTYVGVDGMAPTYVSQLTLNSKKDNSGSYSEEPFYVFYQRQPKSPEYSNYFGLQKTPDGWVIVDAISAATGCWGGRVSTHTKRVIFSRWRHDFRYEGAFFVDGGRDYMRCGGDLSGSEYVKLRLVDGVFVIEP